MIKKMRPTKLRLGVRVPNEGARKLAQFILSEPVGALDALLRKLGMGQIAFERMMAGEIVPDAALLGYRMYAFTRCAVAITDWDRPAQGGWFDRDAAAVVLRRAA